MLTWSNWTRHPQVFATPYVEWAHDILALRSGAAPSFTAQVVPPAADKFRSLDRSAAALQRLEGTENTGAATAPAATAEPQDPDLMISPTYMTNETFAHWWTREKKTPDAWLPGPDNFDYPRVDKDTLIVGMIDVGMAFGHRRFRLDDESTRVLGSWQMGAAVRRDGSGSPVVKHLPFGDHLFEADLNGLLRTHSGGDLTQPLDQDGFNRAAAITDFTTPESDRLLGKRASHGTHVMGLAAGADAQDPSQRRFARNVRFLVVSLPPAFAYGEGGTFLDFYLIYALRWIIEVNRNISLASCLPCPSPLLVNISFGKDAGAKDRAQPFVGDMAGQTGGIVAPLDPLDDFVHEAHFHATMPAGNSNLTQGHAEVRLEAHATLEPEDGLSWVVQPDDDTSNFLEIWSERAEEPFRDTAPLAIELIPPGQESVGTRAGENGTICDLETTGDGSGAPRLMARIYCDRIDRTDPLPQQTAGSPDRGADADAGQREPDAGKTVPKVRYRYLVCLAASRFRGEKAVAPPAGRWRIRLENQSDEPQTVTLLVQTDRSTLPGQSGALLSYLDDPTYRRFDDIGAPRDSDAYHFRPTAGKKGVPEDLDTARYVRRRGTLNSYAANDWVSTIAGYRGSDGKPARYSSTGPGRVRGTHGRASPTVSFQTEDGPAHPGILSDGASDGSVAAMRGTSFACAQATRRVLEAWLDRDLDPAGSMSIETFLEQLGKKQVPPDGWLEEPVGQSKVGKGGRLEINRRPRVPRV